MPLLLDLPMLRYAVLRCGSRCETRTRCLLPERGLARPPFPFPQPHRKDRRADQTRLWIGAVS